MTDEQRLQQITEMLILVRDNLFRGMSKSMQKLQARSINETLGLQNFIESPARPWVGLTDEEIATLHHEIKVQLMGTYKTEDLYHAIENKLKEKNT